MKVAFITGIAGQDGSYLAELLLGKGYRVHGMIRRNSSIESVWRLKHLYQEPHHEDRELVLHYGDVTDASRLHQLIQECQPDELYHLAAQSHVKVSFDCPAYTVDTIVQGTLNVLEAVRLSKREIRVYQASSSEMFGGLQGVDILTEDSPFRPRSPYACAKVFAHHQAVMYREAYGMHVSCGILFNHESPRRGETFVSRKISIGVNRVAAGLQDRIYLGNLDAQRDWGHARDYVRAMWMMLQQDAPGDYVIATGGMHTIAAFAQQACAQLSLPYHRVIARHDRYYRPLDVDALRGCADKARECLGWEPTVGFYQLVAEMVASDAYHHDQGQATPATLGRGSKKRPEPF